MSLICWSVSTPSNFGMTMPGLIEGAFRTHLVRFSWFTGESTPAMSFLLAMCVSSGPTLAAAVVPFTV